MNASSSPFAAMAAKRAFSTNAAALSLQSFSKIDAIGEPKSCVRSVLRAHLIGAVAGQGLPWGYLEPQSAAVGSRGKTADLVYLCEVFRAGCKEQVSGEPLSAPTCQWESETCDSGRPPFDACSRERAPSTRRSQRKRPLPR